MNKIKTLFFGTSDFAIPTLEFLIKNESIDLIGVVTQPDRPAGRKQELKPSDVKEFLVAEGRIPPRPPFQKRRAGYGHPRFHQIRIEQPEKITKEYEIITEILKPELIIVASYGQIIPNSILDFPKYKCLNIHASILPHLRGAVPMPMTILEGLKESGVTLQVMAEKMDEGAIIAIEKFAIGEDEDGETLKEKASKAAVKLLENNLERWINGEIDPVEQDHEQATYCYIADLKKEKAEITFQTDIHLAERMVRALIPWPVAWFELQEGKYKGKRVKIFKASKPEKLDTEFNKLTLFSENNNLCLGLASGYLVLEEIQLEGKNRAVGKDYLWLLK